MLRVSTRVFTALEQRDHFGLAQHVAVHQFDVVDLHALFLDARGERRHGARRDAADIGMMAAGTDVKRRPVIQVHRRDDRDVGQMRAAVVGVVQHIHITRLHGGGILAHHGLDALAHGAQVHRHMRRVGNQVAGGVEQRTAEIEPFLDVDRVGRVLQLQAHLLGNVHEEVVEDLQQHRVHGRSCCIFDSAWRPSDEGQMVKLCQACFPAGLHDGGRILLGDDGRSRDDVTRLQVFAHHQRGIHPLAAAVHAHGLNHGTTGLQITRRMQGVAGFGGGVARNDSLHRHRLHDQALALHQKSKSLLVGRLETRCDLCHDALRRGRTALRILDHQRRIAALVAHMHAPVGGDGADADLLARQLTLGHGGQCIELGGDPGNSIGREFDFDRLLPNHGLVGQPHAISAQHAGQRVHKDARHGQRIGHQTGMLSTGAAKALQGVARHVIATGDRNFLDGVGHLLHCDVDETFRHFLGRAMGLAREFSKFFLHHLQAQGLVRAGAEHLGKIARLDLAQHHIRIGHRQRTTAAVTGRSGICPRTLRADPKTGPVKCQDRATARRHRVNAHHGRPHAHAGHLGLELAFELARVVRHIGRGAAHVKADDLLDARNLRRAGHAHNAARRAAQNRVLTLKHVGFGQATGGLHEEQVHTRHLGRHLLHITPQDGRQIGIHHRGVAAADELHHRAGFMRGADLGKADVGSDAFGRQLVRGVAVTMHEYNRNTS